MARCRLITGALLGAATAVCLVAPAIGAPDRERRAAVAPQISAFSAVGPFTPASPDPKLAALLARSGVDVAAFRFTPTDSRRTNSRAVTVAVRARTTGPASAARGEASLGSPGGVAPTIGLVPIAYNLGVSVGWKHFALSGDVARLDLAGQPGSRESVEAGVSYSGSRLTGRVSALADRPLPGAPRLVGDRPSYVIDVGGAYALSRNFAVTAGVKYKAENYRLTEPGDTRRDSQAAYIGTILRF